MNFELTCVLCLLLACLGGCAVTSDPRDPFQPFNRGVFGFNERVDKAIVAPAARAYRAVLPEFVRTSLGNVFSNIGDVRNVLNNTFQGKLTTAYGDAALDPYLFVRNAYLQRRQSLVRDGAPASGVIEAYGELRPAAATGQLST